MKPLSIGDQVALWCAGLILPAILIPTVSDRSISIYDHFPACAVALILIAIPGMLLSLRFAGARLTEKQRIRRIIILQTIPIWSLAVTYLLIGLLGKVLLAAPREVWNMLE
ncbi:hypothetical protein OpiT1DRAFT_00001 [Opitutaceae bacterium TAV1]|nr:hypothetical protein OpiT1DRAFT_00001 [Opitutaceae bacterium TAV1]